jgi:aminopeptidase
MLSHSEIEDLADKIVNKSMKIGRKPNPAYEKMKRKYKWLEKLGSRFNFARAKKASGMSDKRLEKLLKKFSDVDYGPLVLKDGDRYFLKKQVGHSVYMRYNAADKELARAVERACWRNGANILSSVNSAQKLRDAYMLSPIDSLSELSPLSKAIYSTVDFTINLEAVEKEFWAHGIPLKRLKAPSPAAQKLHKISDKRNVRWVLFGWPHPELAQELEIRPDYFRQVMFNSIMCSYEKSTVDMVNRYGKAFDGAEEIRITADDGTDLTFSTKGRRFLKDDGLITKDDVERGDVGLNIPCGEVFTAPLENSANGNIFYPKASIRGHGLAKGLRLYFEKGLMTHFEAKEGEKYLQDFLAEGTGDVNRIAEFGIGCNREAIDTNGFILIDEKIFGTIHIAIGWNVGYGGKTNASSHLDFIKPLTNCNGNVYADGRLVIQKGKLL